MTAPDAQRMAALEASHTQLVETGERFLEAMSMGPLDAAAKYGPDFDLRLYGTEAAVRFNAALFTARAFQQPSQGESEE